MNRENIRHQWHLNGMSVDNSNPLYPRRVSDLHYVLESRYEEEGSTVYWESYYQGALSIPFTETGFSDWHELSREQVVNWVVETLGAERIAVLKSLAEEAIISKYNVDKNSQEYTIMPWDR